MVECGLKIAGKVKAMKRKIHREPTVTGRKLALKSTIQNTRKKLTFNWNGMKKQKFKT